jgi:hypothetical protein
MSEIDRIIRKKEQELEQLRMRAARLKRESELKAGLDRDYLLVANYQALTAVQRIFQGSDREEARAATAEWMTGSREFITYPNGYGTARNGSYELLVMGDLIDPQNDRFRFTPSKIIIP